MICLPNIDKLSIPKMKMIQHSPISFCHNNFGKNAPASSPTQRKTVTAML